MECENLEEFWARNKLVIGEALPKGTDALAQVLQASAEAFGFTQPVSQRTDGLGYPSIPEPGL
ncbi:MAG: hypothetical protein A2Z25_24750 [Planctomycetes bacterium RBG_16_55_9]|nr:MAG: hypothetical protein A2Z25_24750 [Planctomycetes bacterium RBG_16_55_9]